MFNHIRSLIGVSALAASVLAQATVEPLTDRRYQYPGQIVSWERLAAVNYVYFAQELGI
jgi:hypothetical protein